MAGSVSRPQRRYEIAAAVPVIVAFAALYAWAVPTDGQNGAADMFWLGVLFLIPTSLWLITSSLLVQHWWQGAGVRMSTMDPPGQVLAAAVATLPAARRRWGEAMLGELEQVRERSARWRFALSCARAVLLLPVSRRWSAPAATALVIGAVVACVGAIATFLTRHPVVTDGLVPGSAVILAGCLWLAVAPPPALGGGRLAPHLGVAAAVAFTLGGLGCAYAGWEGLPALWALFGPMLTFAASACVAAAAERSFRAGVRAGVWTVIAVVPLTLATGVFEALRQYAADGVPTFAGDVTSAGFSLGFTLLVSVAVPMIGFPFAVFGATVGATLGDRQASVNPG
ncbi:hypothetical protein [Phytohabitans aurantiacus]|uniref:Uncharacterized protein n=1 Tax=Phytohabitans aurantiacus TaxID=3016789 RepID=A0ABQ5QQL3_9ACTN|nr:hypothetical protein [Phytohabitans aurantiacus]GLH96853.1 hypothetical protein Pa4123_21270 [Phytohabitans aurantiacus]